MTTTTPLNVPEHRQATTAQEIYVEWSGKRFGPFPSLAAVGEAFEIGDPAVPNPGLSVAYSPLLSGSRAVAPVV